MAYLIGIVALVVVLLVAVVLLKELNKTSPDQAASAALPYRKKDWLLSKAEHSFYRVLQQTVADQWVIFAKVRLLDLVWLPRGTQSAQAHRNRVQSKHVDFVLCSPDDIAPLLVIELDDASHEQDERRGRDQSVDQILTAAGLPILRVPAQRTYSTVELRQQIAALVSKPPAT